MHQLTTVSSLSEIANCPQILDGIVKQSLTEWLSL